METRYLDITLFAGNFGFFSTAYTIIPAGTKITAMPTHDKNTEYERYANDYDIHFIFEDNLPTLNIYTVPAVEVFANDRSGGLFGQLYTDLENHSFPIIYINTKNESFLVAESIEYFLQIASVWTQHLIPIHLTCYPSKMAAENELHFLDTSTIQTLLP